MADLMGEPMRRAASTPTRPAGVEELRKTVQTRKEAKQAELERIQAEVRELESIESFVDSLAVLQGTAGQLEPSEVMSRFLDFYEGIPAMSGAGTPGVAERLIGSGAFAPSSRFHSPATTTTAGAAAAAVSGRRR